MGAYCGVVGVVGRLAVAGVVGERRLLQPEAPSGFCTTAAPSGFCTIMPDAERARATAAALRVI